MKATQIWAKRIGWSIAIFFLLDIALGLWVGRLKYVTMTTFEYLIVVLDSVTAWTGRIVWVIAAIWGVAIAVFHGRRPKWFTAEQIITLLINAFPKLLSRPNMSLPAFALLGIAAPILALQLFEKPPLLPSGSVLSTIDVVDDRKEIYVAIQNQGKVAVYNSDFIQKPDDVINIGNPLIGGHPQSIAIAPRKGPNGEIYIVDAGADKVLVVDRKTHSVLDSVGVGKSPRYIVVTPDERKAYVSNEQPIPQGTISVIDLNSRKVIKTITGVNCPEGMAIEPRGKFVYVITQCGAGQDPLFVIDTASDMVVDSIRGFAVGRSVTVTPNGKKLYIAREGFNTRNMTTGTPIAVPAQLSIFDIANKIILRDVPISVSSIAVTADSKYVLLGSEHKIDIMDSSSDQIINTIPLATSPSGIAITKDYRVYVWLPNENRLFLLGLSGLLAGPQRK